MKTKSKIFFNDFFFLSFAAIFIIVPFIILNIHEFYSIQERISNLDFNDPLYTPILNFMKTHKNYLLMQTITLFIIPIALIYLNIKRYLNLNK